MAGVIYDSARESFLKAEINYATDTIKAVLIDTALYTYNAAHNFLDDVSAGIRGTAVTLTSKTTTAGIADAANVTFTGLAAGNPIGAIILYKDTGVAATSNLIAYIDSGVGLPITPDGRDIVVTWSTSGIFKL